MIVYHRCHVIQCVQEVHIRVGEVRLLVYMEDPLVCHRCECAAYVKEGYDGKVGTPRWNANLVGVGIQVYDILA